MQLNPISMSVFTLNRFFFSVPNYEIGEEKKYTSQKADNKMNESFAILQEWKQIIIKMITEPS